MDATITAALSDAQNSLLDTYNAVLTYDKNADEYAKTLLSLFEETLQMKETGKRYELALEKARMQQTLEDLDNVYNDELQSRANKRSNLKTSKEYKEFQEKLNQMKYAFENQNNTQSAGTSQQQQDNRVECEEFVMETAICTTDPLTKRRMENPVKNKMCGHHYEERSIIEAISINPRLRCPVAGCGNNNYVQRQHLVRDDKFRLQLVNTASQGDGDEDDPLF